MNYVALAILVLLGVAVFMGFLMVTIWFVVEYDEEIKKYINKNYIFVNIQKRV